MWETTGINQMIALLNHVTAYVGRTCYVVHRLETKKQSGTSYYLLKIHLYTAHPQSIIEKKKFPRILGLWLREKNRIQRVSVFLDIKISRDRHDRRKRQRIS